jgi:hypothetical protein
VLTLWGAVVAQRLGFDREEALTLGSALAGLNAHAKGVAIGLFKPTPEEVRERRRKLRPAETITVALMGRAVPAVRTAQGLRALSKGRPLEPERVERYLESKFGDALDEVGGAMTQLAKTLGPELLASEAFGLYERFRPQIPPGKRGWGATGRLNLDVIRALATSQAAP